MARFTPVGRVHGLKFKITFKVKGTIVNRKTGQVMNMPERLAGDIAVRMQAAAGDVIKNDRKRKGASTGRLEAAVRSPHNREIKNGKLRVMLPDWLNKEVYNQGDPLRRPYWRAIDQGSSAAVGRRLAGVFATGGEAFPLNREGGTQRFLGPRYFGSDAAEKGRRMLVRSGVIDRQNPENTEALRRTLFRIKRKIEPMRFSQAARDAFALPENAAQQIFREIRSEVIVRRK